MIYLIVNNAQKFFDWLDGFHFPNMIESSTWLLMLVMSFNFISCSSMLAQCFSTLGIRSFKDSHIVHFANIKPLFCTSPLRWYFLLNWLIIHKEILSILNSLLIYNHTHMIMKNNEIYKLTQVRTRRKIRIINMIKYICVTFGIFHYLESKGEHLVNNSQFLWFDVGLY